MNKKLTLLIHSALLALFLVVAGCSRTSDKRLSLVYERYIKPDQMFYVIAGDAATQLKPLAKIGYGQPVLLK
ncbi:MAG TPA: hypothetical protein VJ203_13125 [Bacteroidales bacterium]|nr:hypothetical protein [Bacteroidales bacterium]